MNTEKIVGNTLSSSPLSDGLGSGASEETQTKPHTPIFIFLGVTVLFAVGLGGVMLGKFLYAPKTPLSELNATPTPQGKASTGTPSPDLSAGWKQVINQTFGFRINYPDGWIAECKEPSGNWLSANVCDLRAPNTAINHGELVSGASIGVGVGKPNQNYNTLEEKIAFDTKTYGYTATAKTINGIEGYFISLPGNDAFVAKNGEHFLIVSWIPLPEAHQYKDTLNQILSTFKFLDASFPATIVPTTTTQTDGADLKDIKYSLPKEWEAKLDEKSLFISPINGGGFLSIMIYNDQENIGRREYYCQVSKVCMEGTTYFTEMSIGNISGYVANALDNSGGGPEYFGAKGNKFYIIRSYSPPPPNEFEKNYKNVLNSLRF